MKSVYTRTYTSFSGSDIVATFDGKVVGELQAISFSVTREKAPIYTMGDPNPRSFSRGKRGIAGSLVFSVFDRDSLAALKADSDHKYYTPYANTQSPMRVDEWSATQDANNRFEQVEAMYADQIPPFDITITFRNEYGQSAKMTIYGVEILNEGMGLSIDDITTEKACTFVARKIDPMVSTT